MKAVVKTARGPGHLEYLDVPEPSAAPGGVVIEVTGAGICGTDLHIEEDEHPYWPPVTLGHEFAGRIHELGEGVEGWQVGDRVVSEPHAGACFTCHLCRRGLNHLCAQKRSPGWGIDGALARYVAVPAHLLHAVPDEVSDRAAAGCEPTAIALSALQRVRIDPGDQVAVFGPGPIGLIAAMAARGMGGEVVVVGRSSSSQRLQVAGEVGLPVWNSDEMDVVAAAQERTAGRGFDVVVDTSGAAAAITSGIRMLRRRGRLSAVGVSGKPEIAIPWDDALFRALDVSFSFSSAYTSWDAALSFLRRGLVDVEPLITAFPLSEWRQAFDALQRREVVKAQLVP